MPDGDETFDEDDGVTAGDARADETLGIDRSEQSGLGGNASVLEEYGKDTYRDDLPERPQGAAEPVLPGTDPEVPRDLEAARAPPDPNLPREGHEVREGPQGAVAGLRGKALDPSDPRADR